MSDIYQIAELNADEFVWIIVSKTKYSSDYDFNNRPFMYKAKAQIIEVDYDNPDSPECESEAQTITRHLDLIRAECDKQWSDWVCADIVNPLFPERTITR
jgi:hypothetical protein